MLRLCQFCAEIKKDEVTRNCIKRSLVMEFVHFFFNVQTHTNNKKKKKKKKNERDITSAEFSSERDLVFFSFCFCS